jgi:hypothetical protein
MKQHGGNLGKCACAGSALWDAVLWDSSILGLSSSTRPDKMLAQVLPEGRASVRPFNCMDTFTPCIFLAYFGDIVFFSFQHSVELLKLVWISVAKTLSSSLILLFPQENRTFGISGINLCHLGAEFSILRCRKRFRGSITPKKFGDIFLC